MMSDESSEGLFIRAQGAPRLDIHRARPAGEPHKVADPNAVNRRIGNRTAIIRLKLAFIPLANNAHASISKTIRRTRRNKTACQNGSSFQNRHAITTTNERIRNLK